MPLFFSLLLKILPLYLIVALGFFAGKFFKINKETIAAVLIYIVAPAIVFDAGLRSSFSSGELWLMPLFFMIGCFMCAVVYFISGFFWKDSHRNLLAYTSGVGNAGYFGIPVAAIVLGSESLHLVVLCNLGFILYENTVGFFITARGHHTLQESLFKVFRLPSLYALILGLSLNDQGVLPSGLYTNFWYIFYAVNTLLGMMMIGLGISGLKSFVIDRVFVGIAFFAKFAMWPIVVFLIIWADRTYLHIFSGQMYQVMTLVSIVPMAANTVAIATILRTQPEKAAVAVFLSTVVALVYIPLMLFLLI